MILHHNKNILGLLKMFEEKFVVTQMKVLLTYSLGGYNGIPRKVPKSISI
jgi:hypothetical protein